MRWITTMLLWRFSHSLWIYCDISTEYGHRRLPTVAFILNFYNDLCYQRPRLEDTWIGFRDLTAYRWLWRLIVLCFDFVPGFGASLFHVFGLISPHVHTPLSLWCPWRASRMMSSRTVLRLGSFHRTSGHFYVSESREFHVPIFQNGDAQSWASSHWRNLVQQDKFWRVVPHPIFPTVL